MSYAIITGASSGIGRAIAIELARRNFNLLLVSRDEDTLDKLSEKLSSEYQVAAKVFSIDLSKTSASQKVLEFCVNNNLEIKILINNAGFGLWGSFETRNLVDYSEMMRLNINAVVELSHLFYPILKRNSPSFIMNVASTSAFQPVPLMNVYASSKSFIWSFSTSLRNEWRKDDIFVSCLCPGGTRTNFINRTGFRKPSIQESNILFMTPESVAENSVRKMLSGKGLIIPGLINKLSYLAARILPVAVSTYWARKVFEVKQ